MATEHITIRHCDLCGRKVDTLEIFYYGLIQQDDHRRHPDGHKEVCGNCRAELDAAVVSRITELENKGEKT